MKVKGSRRLVARLGLALAVAAFAVPSASAMTMNAMHEGGGGYGGLRLYADDFHATSAGFTLPASNVRSDAASPYSPTPGANVLTDSVTSSRPVSNLAANVLSDAASPDSPMPGANVLTDSVTSSRPVSNLAANVVTDGASSIQPASAQLTSTPLSATDSTDINWSVAGLGALLGAFGLTLLIGVVYLTGRHNRRSRLAAT